MSREVVCYGPDGRPIIPLHSARTDCRALGRRHRFVRLGRWAEHGRWVYLRACVECGRRAVQRGRPPRMTVGPGPDSLEGWM